jgi:hypothetical protein
MPVLTENSGLLEKALLHVIIYSMNGHDAMAPKIIPGRSIAHAKLSRPQRTALADAYHQGAIDLVRPTVQQAAAVFGTTRGAVYASRHRRNPPILTQISTDVVTAVPTDEEIDALIARAGIDRVWDRMAAMIS